MTWAMSYFLFVGPVWQRISRDWRIDSEKENEEKGRREGDQEEWLTA